MKDEQRDGTETRRTEGQPDPDLPTLYEKVGGQRGAYRVVRRLHPLLVFFLFRPVTGRMLARRTRVIADHLRSVDNVHELKERLDGALATREEISATGNNLDRYANAVEKARNRHVKTLKKSQRRECSVRS